MSCGKTLMFCVDGAGWSSSSQGNASSLTSAETSLDETSIGSDAAGRDAAPGGLRKMKLLNLDGLSAEDLLAGHTHASTLPNPVKDDHDGNH